MAVRRNEPPPAEEPTPGGRPSSPPASWASWLNVAAGVWEFFAPFIWGYSIFTTPLVNNMILGALIFIAGIVAATSFYAWASWWNVAFGVWLIVAPFVLGYSYLSRATGNDVVVGIIVVVLGLIAALSKPSTYGGTTDTRM